MNLANDRPTPAVPNESQHLRDLVADVETRLGQLRSWAQHNERNESIQKKRVEEIEAARIDIEQQARQLNLRQTQIEAERARFEEDKRKVEQSRTEIERDRAANAQRVTAIELVEQELEAERARLLSQWKQINDYRKAQDTLLAILENERTELERLRAELRASRTARLQQDAPAPGMPGTPGIPGISASPAISGSTTSLTTESVSAPASAAEDLLHHDEAA